VSGAGTLYFVATPIGNLEDITRRAARILSEVSMIACEDTRRTRRLLAHLAIRTPIMSMHGHNERTRIPQILSLLHEGKDVAVVADAGMPAISDPGTGLAVAAARQGVRVVPVPGPSAVTTAVALADFPTDRFAFVGFLPRRSGERRRLLATFAALPMALVVFEAPHRLRQTLADIDEVLGGRRMILARELTKVHEEVLRGTAAGLLEALPEAPRGEVTLVIEGCEQNRSPGRADDPTAEAGRQAGRPALPPEEFLRRLRVDGLSRRDAAKALALAYTLQPREAYKLAAATPGAGTDARGEPEGE